jgi:integrase/ribosomal protein L37AE/L43A
MAGLTSQETPDCVFGEKAGSNTGKSEIGNSAGSSPLCPQCGSQKVWRDGERTSPFGDVIQRWLCRKCKLRFSDPQQQSIVKANLATLERKVGLSKSIKSKTGTYINSQIRVEETKNLDPEQQTSLKAVPERIEDIKGTLVQFAWKMQQEGYDKETIRTDGSCLKGLILRGANLNDPESVKTALAKEQKWSQSRKSNAINSYTLYLKFKGMSWNKPKCPIDRKFPFIPSEQEIDALIAGSHKKHAAFMQLLKETAMRSGEAQRIEWTDIDKEKRIITLNKPEKRSNPRMWRVTETLIEMLNAQPKTTNLVFNGSMRAMKTTLDRTRKRLADKLQNPRLLRIHFHTFRHWKATTLYHQTKDPYYVQHFLGHKSIKSTEIYINIEHTLFEAGANDQFTVRIAEKPEEIKEFLETGFEYVCQKDNLIFLRKGTSTTSGDFTREPFSFFKF